MFGASISGAMYSRSNAWANLHVLWQPNTFLTECVLAQMRPEMLEGAGLLQLDGRHAAAGARPATGDAAILSFWQNMAAVAARLVCSFIRNGSHWQPTAVENDSAALQ
jgi:hypothetical protein